MRVGSVQALDDTVDDWWEQWRGQPVLDRVFFTATNAGEFSALWHGMGLARALRGGWSWRTAVRFSAAIGLESLIVNQGIKRLFGRGRPSTAADNDSELHLRQPITSSFPSGHASAAFCAAAMLAPTSRVPLVVRGIAATVATSRIHVRLHHASDVTGGALTGALLGRVFRRFLS